MWSGPRPGRRRCRRSTGALALASLLAAPDALASPRPTDEPATLAERIDLTRITVLEADYARAAGQGNTGDLAAFDREIAAMLRDEILAYARDGARPGARAGGTGAGAAPPARDAAVTPAVAVDEEEVGAAALDARVAQLAREFISLEEKLDHASVARKSSIIGSLQAISSRAQFPGTPPSAEQSREARQRAAKERREREGVEDLPVK
jgi:hypothetical protein